MEEVLEDEAVSEAIGEIPGSLTETGLALPDGLDFEAWERAGRTLGRLDRSLHWAIGDWILYGENSGTIGEMASQASDVIGYEPKTLQNIVWVVQRFDPDRRRATLSFKHHEIVAKLDAGQQDKFLDLAESENWTVAELRGHVRGDDGQGARATSTEAHYFELHIRWKEHPEADAMKKLNNLVTELGGEIVKTLTK